MSGNSPRAAVGSFPYPHRTVAQVDAAEGRIFAAPAPRPVRGPSHTNIRPIDDSRAQRAPERIVCPRCQAINCTRHAAATSGWQRFVRSA